MKVSVMGAGAFGLSVAHRLSTNPANEVTVWTSSAAKLEEFERTGAIASVLDGHVLPGNISMTTSAQAAADADLVFVLTTARYVGDVCRALAPHMAERTRLIVGSKGACPDGSFPAVVAAQTLGHEVSAIAGPGFAIDIIEDVPVGFTFASSDDEAFRLATQAFSHDSKFILDRSHDIMGVELCSCMKNAAALACGALLGSGHPVSTQCLLMQRVLADISHMLEQIEGGSRLTPMSLAGVGDLILTCFSTKSRNSTFGFVVGQHGFASKEAREYLAANTVEGLTVVEKWDDMSRTLGVESKFMDIVGRVFCDNGNIESLTDYISS